MERHVEAEKSITHSSSAPHNYYTTQLSFRLPAHIHYHHIHSLHNTQSPVSPNSTNHHNQNQNAVLHHLRCRLCSRFRHGCRSPDPNLDPSQRTHSPLALARHCRPLGCTFFPSPCSYVSTSSPGLDRTSASRASTTRLASRSRRISITTTTTTINDSQKNGGDMGRGLVNIFPGSF